MMQDSKTLLLLRHGKAEGHDPKGDHARHLNKHGRQQVGKLVAHWGGRLPAPQRVLVSSAKRTRQTAEILCQGLGWPDSRVDDELYLAEPQVLLDCLGALESEVNSALLVGHNPGLSELLARLLRPASVPGLPTGGLAVLSFAGDWDALAGGSVVLQHFCDPDELP